jgi:secreted PhoX family phosphatase
MLTNNSRRKYTQVDAVNPRLNNTAGHIVELIAPGEGAGMDHTADEFTWELFISAGDPVWGGTLYGKGTSKNGWFACPDNCAFDSKGRIWIATDQGGAQAGFGIGDGIWAADTAGDGRAVSRFFFRGPRGGEICGPTFTPDSKTLFVSIQHPAEIEGESTFDTPANRWPDNVDGMPPRPSVIALTKEDGAELGA